MDKIVILGGLAIISGVSLLLMKNEKRVTKKRSPTPKKRSPSPNSPIKTPLPTIRKTIKATPRKEKSLTREPTREPTRRANPVQETVRLPRKPVVEIPRVATTRSESPPLQLRRAASRSRSPPSRSRSPTRSRSPSRSLSPKRSILKRASTSPRRVYSPTPPPLNIPRGVLRRSVSDSATINSDRGADPFFSEETRPLTDREWEEANVLSPTSPTRSRRRSESRN